MSSRTQLFAHGLLAAETSGQATGIPAILIILGVLGLLVAGGMAIAGRRPLAGKVAISCLLALVAGFVWANLD